MLQTLENSSLQVFAQFLLSWCGKSKLTTQTSWNIWYSIVLRRRCWTSRESLNRRQRRSMRLLQRLRVWDMSVVSRSWRRERRSKRSLQGPDNLTCFFVKYIHMLQINRGRSWKSGDNRGIWRIQNWKDLIGSHSLRHCLVVKSLGRWRRKSALHWHWKHFVCTNTS